jgi:DNA-binding response OmpR family regulator
MKRTNILAIFKQIRGNRRDLTVLVMTDRAKIDDKVNLLDQGADGLWRKRWDSNPRYGSPHASFQD